MVCLSVCMIVKNEEDVLQRGLECLTGIADEIIIVDTGSTDKTKEIAYTFTNKVYDFKWCEDFSKARNYSFSKATGTYMMWLDADDIILEEDQKKLIALKEELEDNTIDMVMLKYNMGIPTDDTSVLSYYRERIFRRERNYKWKSPIHEVIEPSGTIIQRDIAITHVKLHANAIDRNLKIFENMIAQGNTLDARQQFYYARELSYNKRIDESILNYEQFLACETGWIENKINACLELATLYQKQHSTEKILPILFQSFQYDIPRAEICCQIGYYFLEQNNFNIAIYWYEQALSKTLDLESGGFHHKDCYGFLPAIQLCVCYDKLGNTTLANHYNELAGQEKPTHPVYLNNKTYFENKLLNK